MIKNLNIRVAINSEVTKAFTKYCKENGFKPGVVLKYLIENREILDQLCDDMYENPDTYTAAAKYLREVSKLPENNGTPYKLEDVDSNVSLKNILKDHGVSVVFFFCYLVTNREVLDNICDSIPSEYKMRKCQ